MAELFRKQAKNYAEARPGYPAELFQFIASKTPNHDLAWDVGTGSGQAAVSLAKIYKSVVGSDTSREQLAFAPELPNVRYVQTPATISLPDLQRDVAAPSTVDLITVAQAVHWFHLPTFYAQARHLLRGPHGVLAAWCYTVPRVDPPVDSVFSRLYTESGPFWAPQRRTVDDELRSIDFPFDPVEGEAHTGPFEFMEEREMDLETYLTYIRSWSAYQTAREKAVELLSDGVVTDLERAWGGDGKVVKLVRYPIFLRIGKVRTY
ncbi:putative methyltransferase DDB_G0268948 [Phoenix dactylifera]|uniref:Methyltransferase DDB_G0268948 n=1 Tax=Phoenix dactylifera TaxID=42345 RepID=A0A8B9AQZ1_PHODC|nr:putative methyltransferase DDB_G0268948 [Phoenix dactylifera]